MAGLLIGRYDYTAYSNKTSPKPAEAPAGKSAKEAKISLEDPLQRIRELTIEECKFPEVLLEINKLPKEVIENSPELWVYVAVAYRRVGKNVSAQTWENRFLRWHNNHKNEPQAIILNVILLQRSFMNSEAAEAAECAINNDKLFSSFSLLEKKTLLTFAGISTNMIVFIGPKDAIGASKKAEDYLKQALKIKIEGDKQADFFDYLCRLNLGSVYASIALYTDDPTDKEQYYKKSLEEYNAALVLRPNAWRPCMEWKSLIQKGHIHQNPPAQCRINYPQEPPRIKINIIEAE